jgi:hypothetical protein
MECTCPSVSALSLKTIPRAATFRQPVATQNKSRAAAFPGNPAVSGYRRPVAFRPCLAAGLALSDETYGVRNLIVLQFLFHDKLIEITTLLEIT